MKKLYLLLSVLITNVAVQAQGDVKRANQIVKELFPDKNIVVYSDGIATDEFSYLSFSDEKYDTVPLITVNEEDLYLSLCCVPIMTFEDGDTDLENEIIQFFTTVYSFEPHQLPLAKELETLVNILRTKSLESN